MIEKIFFILMAVSIIALGVFTAVMIVGENGAYVPLWFKVFSCIAIIGIIGMCPLFSKDFWKRK